MAIERHQQHGHTFKIASFRCAVGQMVEDVTKEFSRRFVLRPFAIQSFLHPRDLSKEISIGVIIEEIAAIEAKIKTN